MFQICFLQCFGGQKQKEVGLVQRAVVANAFFFLCEVNGANVCLEDVHPQLPFERTPSGVLLSVAETDVV